MKKKPRSHSVKQFYLHLVSDATGTTLQGLARACLAQFDDIDPVERFWPLVRTPRQMERVLADIADYPGPVLFTLVDHKLRKMLKDRCRELDIPCMPIMDPIIRSLSSYLSLPSKNIPGLQHELDEAYFHRIDAIDFALSFDDGQQMDGIEEADVVIVGVSRTSKTPTCIYLARRGIMAANIPYVPGVPFPERALQMDGPLMVGLTEAPDRLVGIRRARLKAEEEQIAMKGNAYLDPEKVSEEIREARRFFARQGWPVIDVTRRSIEETAAEITVLLQKHRSKKLTAGNQP